MPGANEPVIEGHYPFRIVVTRFVGIIDDQRGVQPAVQLQADMGVEEVGPGIGYDELIGEGRLRLDGVRSEEHTSELQSRGHLVCRPLLDKKKKNIAEDKISV